jgi:hypothetical protein
MLRCPPRTAVAAPAPNRRPKAAAKVNCYNRRFSAGADAVKRAAAGAMASLAVRPSKCKLEGTPKASLLLPRLGVRTRSLSQLARAEAAGLGWDAEVRGASVESRSGYWE